MIEENKKEGGLVLALDENVPALVCMGDVVVKVYLLITHDGKNRVRIVSDKEKVIIYGPNKVRKGLIGDTKLDDPRANR